MVSTQNKIAKEGSLLTLSQCLEDVVHILTVCSRCADMLDALLACKVLSRLLVDRLIQDVTLVSSHDDRCILTDFVDQLTVPFCCTLEGVLVCHVVDEERPCSVLIVHFLKGVVLLLSGCVPNDELDALISHLNSLL